MSAHFLEGSVRSVTESGRRRGHRFEVELKMSLILGCLGLAPLRRLGLGTQEW